MSQYLIWIASGVINDVDYNGYLYVAGKIDAEHPVPAEKLDNVEQILMTNTTSFNEIVAAFRKYGGPNLVYSYDSEAETISVSGAYSKTWNID